MSKTKLDQGLMNEFKIVGNRLAQESKINWTTCVIKCEDTYDVPKLTQEEKNNLVLEEKKAYTEIWALHDKLLDIYKEALETGEATELISALEEVKNSPYCKSLDGEKIGIAAIIDDGKEGKDIIAHWNGNANDLQMCENVKVLVDGEIHKAKLIGVYLEKDGLENVAKTQAFRADMSEVDINKTLAAMKEPRTLQGLLSGVKEQKEMMKFGQTKMASKNQNKEL